MSASFCQFQYKAATVFKVTHIVKMQKMQWGKNMCWPNQLCEISMHVCVRVCFISVSNSTFCCIFPNILVKRNSIIVIVSCHPCLIFSFTLEFIKINILVYFQYKNGKYSFFNLNSWAWICCCAPSLQLFTKTVNWLHLS